jgi:hypothetical protein
MFDSSRITSRRFCLALILLAATALSAPGGKLTATVSYPAPAGNAPGSASVSVPAAGNGASGH